MKSLECAILLSLSLAVTGALAQEAQTLKERANELRGQAEPGSPVCLRTPPGVSAVQLPSGTRCKLAPDGTVEMSEIDAAPLPRAGWTKVDDETQLK